VPARRQADTFENFDLAKNPEMRPALEQCQRVASGEAWCALLVGGYGNGKTHLAIATLSAMHRLESGYFWKVPDFLSWVRARHFEDSEPMDGLLASYRTGQALIVFDDLGAENQTEFAAEQLYRVLDSRYDNELPTVVTSNTPFERMDQRILDRFASGLVVCGGESVRGRL
jgi:DNA replication protein DnaC